MSSTAAQHLSQWKERFDALTLRERALITLATLVILYLLVDSMLLGTLRTHRDARHTEMQQLNNLLSEIDQQIELVSAGKESVDKSTLTAQAHKLSAELEQLRQQQQTITGKFIRPTEMTQALRGLLQENGLTLVRLQSLASENILADEKKIVSAASISTLPGIYKHAVSIELQGSYLNTLKYLRSLEQLPWRLYWDSVDYQVASYPNAKVTIVVYTLSLHEGWIGV